ncbi:hypothetical protein K402DRAFT_460840 [Aulographum hederae CBS 113979]|uniref:Uncharacterized protein n=1 Tax=Aulographum hederae CBS 113979 TaxID=1176131 RepID=A0A6G1HAU2_9PEZI|nr:hypothetical protein K402DRAFT_460840 [Aulographum hederae CBS 113979]
MDSTRRDPAEPCYLLQLPVELRLAIYDFALCDAPVYTIGTAVDQDPLSLFERVANRGRTKDLPNEQVPLLLPHYDASILSFSNPPTIVSPTSSLQSSQTSLFSASSTSASSNSTSSALIPPPAPINPTPPTWALLSRLNRQINAELHHHIATRKRSPSPTNSLSYGTSLYLTYPYGILAFMAHCPSLLLHARHIRVSGFHNPTPPRDGERGPVFHRPLTTFHGRNNRAQNPVSTPSVPPATQKAALAALAKIVRACLGPGGHTTLERFQLRMYYPGRDSYYSVWSDEGSPVSAVLYNTCAGRIDMEAWRGARGTGMKVDVRPARQGRCGGGGGGGERVVSTVWRKLGDSWEENEGFGVDGEGE